MRRVTLTLATALTIHQPSVVSYFAQDASIPAALAEMAEQERAFVRRAQAVGWKQAFLDYFADNAVGFQGPQPAPAKDGIRKQPDPPKELEFWWEPRYGDIAASGELGWLTGPVRTRHPARNGGNPVPGNYMSIWKRQVDGTFKVIIDIGIQPPSEVLFPAGVTRVPFADRYTGSQIAPLAHASLLAADRALSTAAQTSLADAYAQALAPAARLHRNGHLPLTTRDAAVSWLRSQPVFSAAEPLYAEAAQSADLGYTWGSYAFAAAEGEKAEAGHYARVWSRDSQGRWWVVLDITQPRPPSP